MASLPLPSAEQVYVRISPIDGGQITIPERSFVFPNDPKATTTVPSMSFLITHPNSSSGQPTRLLFDLGLRSHLEAYISKQQVHIQNNRVPYRLGPGVAQSLRDGGLDPSNIDKVILSHVHYDHHGDPGDFPRAEFLVGPGSLKLLQQGLNKTESHQVFDPHLFPDLERVQELPAVEEEVEWQPLGPFEAAMDLFHDGSVFVVHAPGHLPGHVNLLCRVGEKRWMYLGGDSCHDTRLLSGERSIATWTDPHGHMQCIHLDKTRAEDTLQRIRQLMQTDGEHVEVVLAHDGDWWLRNRDKAFPAGLN